MKTLIEEKDGLYLVTLEGELDSAEAVEAEKVLRPLYDTCGKDVIIDCAKLEYIASSGLRLFLMLLQNTKPNGCSIIVKGACEELMSVFESTGFKNLFKFI